jgi:hypothetical protein
MKKVLIFLPFMFFNIFSFSQMFSYDVIQIVNKTPNKINKNLKFKSDNLNELINESLRLTLSDLSFNLKSKGNSNVDFLLKSKEAHCVGYSNYFNSILLNLVQNNNLKKIRIYHVRAKIKFCGINLHIIDKKEFKDHDVCVVYDDINKQKFIIDPSLSEIFGKIIVN